MSSQYVVILTSGALPGQETPQPGRIDIDLALQRSGLAVRTDAEDALARKVAAVAFRHGYERGARDHRVVAAYVLDGEGTAARFAEFVTREIDPAYVTVARSPLDELFASAEELRRDQSATGGRR